MSKKFVAPGVASRKGSTDDSIRGYEGEKHTPISNYDIPPKNLSIPANAISEESLLRGIPRSSIRPTLGKMMVQVRHGRMRRVVVKGMPFYIPVTGVRV